jgi:hypothetical protein
LHREVIGIGSVQTAIEYEYRFTEYRPPRRTEYEYEYDEIRCDADQVVWLIAFNSQPQAYWIQCQLQRPVRLRLTVKRNLALSPGTCHFAPSNHAIDPGG